MGRVNSMVTPNQRLTDLAYWGSNMKLVAVLGEFVVRRRLHSPGQTAQAGR